jgi:hypothetical protein
MHFPFVFANLTPEVRTHMAAEVAYDQAHGGVYLNKRLSHAGQSAYPKLLSAAVADGDNQTLLASLDLDRHFYPEQGRDGSAVPLPVSAVETYIYGEWNKFYMRGLCAYAVEQGIPQLEIYRARPSAVQPSLESRALVGTLVSPDATLAELRVNFNRHVLGKPNSGLSLRIPIQKK